MTFLNSANVLIVDDEPGITIIVKEMMEDIGVNCQTFNNPLEALDSLKIKQPDLLITDLKMPEMDGMELFQKLKHLHIEIPTIFLSAHISKDLLMNAIETGVYGFIDKPIKEARFKYTVKTALAKTMFQKKVQEKAVSLINSFHKLDLLYNSNQNNPDFEIFKMELEDLENMHKSYSKKVNT